MATVAEMKAKLQQAAQDLNSADAAVEAARVGIEDVLDNLNDYSDSSDEGEQGEGEPSAPVSNVQGSGEGSGQPPSA